MHAKHEKIIRRNRLLHHRSRAHRVFCDDKTCTNSITIFFLYWKNVFALIHIHICSSVSAVNRPRTSSEWDKDGKRQIMHWSFGDCRSACVLLDRMDFHCAKRYKQKILFCSHSWMGTWKMNEKNKMLLSIWRQCKLIKHWIGTTISIPLSSIQLEFDSFNVLYYCRRSTGELKIYTASREHQCKSCIKRRSHVPLWNTESAVSICTMHERVLARTWSTIRCEPKQTLASCDEHVLWRVSFYS